MQAVDTDRVKMGDRDWRVTCASCGKQFEATRSDASFCSARCRKYYSRAPERKQGALNALRQMSTSAYQITKSYRHSQDVYDEMVKLHKSIGNLLGEFETRWEQKELEV